MKNAESIISHLINKPAFKNVAKARCLRSLIDYALPQRLARFVAFCYIRNDILFIAITHPGIKMELYYKDNLLKSILTMLQKSAPECKIIKFEKIKTFVIHQKTPRKDPDTQPHYKEHAKGEFENRASDEELAARFEKIRNIIVAKDENP